MIGFSKTFTSIILEAIPFILIGSFISAIIQMYLSEDKIKKLIPNGSTSAYFKVALAGLVIPVCECAIIPITRRLIKKGMPLGVGVTFMLSVPIINPLVIMSTYYAFSNNKEMIILRIFGGFVTSIIVGIIVSIVETKKESLFLQYVDSDNYCNCGCNYNNINENKIKAVIEHTNREFLDILRYLIIGALISSLFQSALSNGFFRLTVTTKISMVIFMMILGFLLSLCSEADAFIGKTFLNEYSLSSIAAFLIIGPMLDIKSLVILLGTFKKSFVFKLAITTIITVFIISYIFIVVGL